MFQIRSKDNDDYVNGGGFCCDDNPGLRAGAIGAGNDNPETFQYYYHSDHLGSASLITNLDGEVVQHVEYVPFGDVFIEERNNTWNTPYLFNAKELDEETGLYYYGARYYDSRTSVWLSTDPLQEKYPNISTYAYALLNPVKFIDPNGMEVYYDTEGSQLGQIGENTDVRILNSSMKKADALSHIESGSEESIIALMDNSTAFADYFTTVNDVTNGAAVVPFNFDGEKNCYTAAEKQMKDAGYGVAGSRASSTVFTKVGEGTDNPNNLTENTVGGAIKIMTDLKNGKPVMVGVEQTNAVGNFNRQNNTNPLTSHFIVVNSSSVSDGVVSFNYLDNASGRGPLNLNTSNGAISGGITNRGAVKNYTISEVRSSWKTKR
jgi:RHS repeat-associated protein